MLNQRLQQALQQQRDGNLAAAQRKCRSILQKAPNHGETLQLLAILMQQSGNSRSALHFMQKALKTAPEDPNLLKNLAEIYRSRGELEQAQNYARAALEIAPDNSDALFISGAVFVQQGDRQQAIEQFARVVAICPDDVEAHNELGNLMCAGGDLANAVNHYQLALEARPGFADCRINLADTLVDCGDFDSAIDHYQQVLELEPYNAAVHNQLGLAFTARGDNDSAISSFELALEQDPLLLEARLNMGKINLECDPHQAENWFKSVLDIEPKSVDGYYWLGILFQTLGKFERASNYLQQASRIDPEYSFAWYRLSLDRNFRPSPQQLEILQRQFERKVEASPDDDNLIELDFTLGRFHEQRGDFAASFKHYQHGNRLKSRKDHFDRDLHDAQIDNVINIFDDAFFRQRSGWGIDSELPLFVIGMPRSGTTLIQQILAAHTRIHGAGELPLMLELASSLSPKQQDTPNSHARRVAALEQHQVLQIALDQLEQMQSLAPEASHIVDKLPGNYFRLGLIRLLFPKAVIIHCRRDPMDTCWSCYQQNFESGLNFSNDLQNLGHAYCGYRRLMAHWHRLFPGQILDVDYENLVMDPETTSRKLLQHCAVEWQPRVLDYHKFEQPVNTASLWQARQPVYQSSIGRWKSYRKYLKPLARQISHCR
ncbi:MAG: sulfotransferase [Gammaproteobacteria bacterium]|nr:sulfotransferase [Gammaproteobacteria bacterium]